MRVVAAFIMVLLIFLVFGLPLLAAPVPPLLVVNHTTKECATILGGDECMECYPPEGWEILGYGHDAQCPEGYTLIDNLEGECMVLKDRFCCSEGHSGVHGDCEDLVLHKKRKLCAFVDDINTVVLPEGWDQKAEDLLVYHWFCPSGYDWVDWQDAVPEVELDSTPEVVDEGGTGSEGGGLPCPGAALVGPAGFGLLFLRTRNRDNDIRSAQK